MDVAPVNVLAPERVRVPEPVFVRVPLPVAMTPDMLVFPLPPGIRIDLGGRAERDGPGHRVVAGKVVQRALAAAHHVGAPVAVEGDGVGDAREPPLQLERRSCRPTGSHAYRAPAKRAVVLDVHGARVDGGAPGVGVGPGKRQEARSRIGEAARGRACRPVGDDAGDGHRVGAVHGERIGGRARAEVHIAAEGQRPAVVGPRLGARQGRGVVEGDLRGVRVRDPRGDRQRVVVRRCRRVERVGVCASRADERERASHRGRQERDAVHEAGRAVEGRRVCAGGHARAPVDPRAPGAGGGARPGVDLGAGDVGRDAACDCRQHAKGCPEHRIQTGARVMTRPTARRRGSIEPA